MEHTAQKNIEEWCSIVNRESSYGQEEWFAPNMTKLVEEWCTIYMKSSVQSRGGGCMRKVVYGQKEWCTINTKSGVQSRREVYDQHDESKLDFIKHLQDTSQCTVPRRVSQLV